MGGQETKQDTGSRAILLRDPGHGADSPRARMGKPQNPALPGLYERTVVISPGNHRTLPELMDTSSNLDGFAHRVPRPKLRGTLTPIKHVAHPESKCLYRMSF